MPSAVVLRAAFLLAAADPVAGVTGSSRAGGVSSV